VLTDPPSPVLRSGGALYETLVSRLRGGEREERSVKKEEEEDERDRLRMQSAHASETVRQRVC
jgi:hypothetical protein